MNTTTKTAAPSLLAPAFALALIGLSAMFVAGVAQSATMHDAAHDMRHATGFPCH